MRAPLAAAAPLLVVDRLRKEYRTGLLNRRTTFTLEADFAIDEPAVVGMMGRTARARQRCSS